MKKKKKTAIECPLSLAKAVLKTFAASLVLRGRLQNMLACSPIKAMEMFDKLEGEPMGQVEVCWKGAGRRLPFVINSRRFVVSSVQKDGGKWRENARKTGGLREADTPSHPRVIKMSSFLEIESLAVR